MVKRAGDRARAKTPQFASGSQHHQAGGVSSPTAERHFADIRSPSTMPPVLNTTFNTEIPESYFQSSAKGTLHPQQQLAMGPPSTDMHSMVPSPKQQQQYLHQHQATQPAPSPTSRRVAGSMSAAAAAASGGPAAGVKPVSVMHPGPDSCAGQRSAGLLSTVFTGGGMWSSQGRAGSQQAAAHYQPDNSASHAAQPQTGARSPGVGGSAMSRHSVSSRHSVLSAGSYQAAAAAAAAAVVAANARNRGVSPGMHAMEEVESRYVAAAASAAVNRALSRTPSPGPQQAGFEPGLLQRSSRGASPGRGMCPVAAPGAAALGMTHHSPPLAAIAAAHQNLGQRPPSGTSAGYFAPDLSPRQAISPGRRPISPGSSSMGVLSAAPAAAGGEGPYSPGSSHSRAALTAAALAQLNMSRASAFPHNLGPAGPPHHLLPDHARGAGSSAAGSGRALYHQGPNTNMQGPAGFSGGQCWGSSPYLPGGTSQAWDGNPAVLQVQSPSHQAPPPAMWDGTPASLRMRGPPVMAGPTRHGSGVDGSSRHSSQWTSLPVNAQQPTGKHRSSGRMLQERHRSSSDCGAYEGDEAQGAAEMMAVHRPSSDSQLRPPGYLEQQELQWQRCRSQQQQQQQQQPDEEGRSVLIGDSSDEEPARWHDTLARHHHQQQQQQWHTHQRHHQQQQQEGSDHPRRSAGMPAAGTGRDAEREHQQHARKHNSYKDSCGAAAAAAAAEMQPAGRGSPECPVPPTSKALSPSSRTSGLADEDRRNTQHSSTRGSRAASATLYRPGEAAPTRRQQREGELGSTQGPSQRSQGERPPSSASRGKTYAVPPPTAPTAVSGTSRLPEDADVDAEGSAAGAYRGAGSLKASLQQDATAGADLLANKTPAASGAQQQQCPDEACLQTGRERGDQAAEDAKLKAGVGSMKYGRIQVRVSVGSEDDSPRPAGAWCGLSRRAAWTLVTVFLLVVMAGVGVGVGMAFANGRIGPVKQQQQQQTGPAAAAAMSALFGVSARPFLAGWSSNQRCQAWFGPPEKLQQYQLAFAAAYGQVLGLSSNSIQVVSITCDGAYVFSPTSSVGSPRRLLSDSQGLGSPPAAGDPLMTALLSQQSPSATQQQDSSSEVVTTFTITTSADAMARSELSSQVVAAAAGTLAAPLASFFQAPVQVYAAKQLLDWQNQTGLGGNAAQTWATMQQRLPAFMPQQQLNPFIGAAPISTSAPASQQQQVANGQHHAGATQSLESHNHHDKDGKAPATGSGANDDGDTGAAPAPPRGAMPAPSPPHAASGAGGKTAAKAARNDDYYLLDEEDAAADDYSSIYAGLDPEEMPIEPPPPGKPAADDEAQTATEQADDVSHKAVDDSKQWVDYYDNAATCSTVPTIVNSVYDGAGRLWGWDKSTMCVFRATSPQWAPVTWKEAVACSGVPSATNSVYDESGKLWGWQNNGNCAFHDTANKPVALTWKAAPACIGQATSSNSITDVNGKQWGWSNSRTCAFR